MVKKINFIGFWKNFNKTDNFIYNILKERYDLEISDTPDYLFCSPLCKPFEYMKYDCVRILFSGEFLSPNFVEFDYAIAFDYIDFGDRYLRFPLYLLNNPQRLSRTLSLDEAKNILKKKKYFCNFVFGHSTDSKIRENIFHALNNYKRVESAGSFLNNQINGEIVNYAQKFLLLNESKFTISAESLVYPGFTSEKIGDAFISNSIPIYFGDPCVEKDFNPKAFINYANFNSIEDLIDKVIEVDRDDDLYIKMLLEPITNDPLFVSKKLDEFNKFIFNIIDQEPEQAYRRMRFYQSKTQESFAKEYANFHGTFWYNILKKLRIIK